MTACTESSLQSANFAISLASLVLSLDYRAATATDIAELQQIIKEQNKLQKIHITLG